MEMLSSLCLLHSPPDPKLTDGRFYQWQLCAGDVWLDVGNDHILEAQYSLPHTKGIKIYNTPYGWGVQNVASKHSRGEDAQKQLADLALSLSLSLCRAVSMDFNRMRVIKKSLRVRRLDDGTTVWVWYCTLRRKWTKYGDKVDGGQRVRLCSASPRVCAAVFGLNVFLLFFHSSAGFEGQTRTREERRHREPVPARPGRLL